MSHPSLPDSKINTQGRVYAARTGNDKQSRTYTRDTPVLAAGRNHTELQRNEAACPTGAVRVRGAGGSVGPIPASRVDHSPTPTPQNWWEKMQA